MPDHDPLDIGNGIQGTGRPLEGDAEVTGPGAWPAPGVKTLKVRRAATAATLMCVMGTSR